MKNKYLLILLLIFFKTNLYAKNLKIEAKNITLNKDQSISIFENEVIIKTKNKVIKSDYVKYQKSKGILLIRKNIKVSDDRNNIIETEYAEYDEKNQIFKSKGPTKILTSEKYTINTEDVFFNNKSKFIKSDKNSILSDLDGNQIYLENFNYQIKDSIFKSIGLIKIEDKKDNVYEFSQIYIDTQKKEILGTDIKAFLNDDNFKINNKNKPRVFANTIQINKESSNFSKSIFTICDYRENDKCPPWSIQATEMLHDNKKKTIYYENAVIKVYDIPIFYFPKLSHPDPTVERRSGFLTPSFTDSKNLGSGISLPYFFDFANDKNFTLTSKIFASENPLFVGEYHQAFKNSTLFADFGYTEGYKKTSNTKKSGDKSHFFSKYIKNFTGKNNSQNTIDISVQDVSNDKYLKLYKIKSNLVDYNQDMLENYINFVHENDDIFFGINVSAFETIKETNKDKYEFILPEVTFDKNIFSSEVIGNLDLQTNLKIHNYDTNKLTKFLVNDFKWNSADILSENGFRSNFLGNFKNINYEVKNVDEFKQEATSEIFGALGFFTELDLFKQNGNLSHLLTPKFMLKYAPGSMRQETSGKRLDVLNAFSLDRLNELNNFETGLSSSVGLDYEVKNNQREFNLSLAQVINEKENKKMPDESSLNEKLSDLVGSSSYKLNNNFSLNYDFSLDQNYSEFNYNEIGSEINVGSLDVNLSYLKEQKHIGDQEYFKTKINLKDGERGLFSFETKRNLLTSSAEFYNLSYEYINDCLRAGLVYRREFYNDSEIEPENSLMFKITLTPFGSINSPTFDQ